jgi:hypothetical protein
VGRFRSRTARIADARFAVLKTRIAGIGDRLTLDPPGIAVAVSDLFADLDTAFAD